MMRRVRIEEVIRLLDLDADPLLEELRSEGLFEQADVSAAEADELRVAVTWIRELGVNAAGADVALQLRRRLLCLEERVRWLLKDRERSR